jgi:two-component system NtrC family response regulator
MGGSTLVVCPNATERAVYAEWLQAGGYPVVQAASAEDAVAYHRSRSLPLTVAELNSASLDGVELIHTVRQAKPLAEFLMLSSGDSVNAVVAAMKAGATELLVKPVSREKLLESVRQLCGLAEACADSRHIETELRRRYDFSEIVARSPNMLDVLAIVARVAGRDTPVLITGESGTGKELVTRAIHRNSARANRPMVSLNCAAIPENLLESELFGYLKGAFTGADADKPGLLSTADGGTLFLDEVAELPLTTQAKLLRFIQEGTFSPLGGVYPHTADVRLVSATNAPLAERVDAGAFRRDLYYRLSVFPVHVPPLRERLEDIVPLAQHFLQLLAKGTGTKAPGLSREVVHYLTAKSWRGNVRELQSSVERAVIISEGSLLTSADFRKLDRWTDATLAPPSTNFGKLDQFAAPTPVQTRDWTQLPEEGIDLPELNRKLIVAALERTRYKVSAAARILGLSRPALRYRMKKYRLDVS